MQHDGLAVRAHGKPRRRDACECVALRVGRDHRGHVLRLHLERLVRVRRPRIEQQPRVLRVELRRMRPEVRREEAHRPLEVARVEEQRPAVVAGGDVLATRRRLRRNQRQRQVAVAEEIAARSLGDVQPVDREQQPRRELRDAVQARGLLPVARTVRGAIRDLLEVDRDAAHDELRRLRRKARVAPPSEPALDVGVEVLRRLALVLGVHPSAEEPRLEAMTRIVLEQRPRRGVQREARVEILRHLVAADEHVPRHLGGLRLRGRGFRRVGLRGCGEREGQREQGGSCDGCDVAHAASIARITAPR